MGQTDILVGKSWAVIGSKESHDNNNSLREVSLLTCI